MSTEETRTPGGARLSATVGTRTHRGQPSAGCAVSGSSIPSRALPWGWEDGAVQTSGKGCVLPSVGESDRGSQPALHPTLLFHSLEQLVSPLAFPATSSSDPCAKETVLNAIRESRKRAVEEEEEEDQTFRNDQESKRR